MLRSFFWRVSFLAGFSAHVGTVLITASVHLKLLGRLWVWVVLVNSFKLAIVFACIAIVLLLPFLVLGSSKPVLSVEEVVEYEIQGYFILVNKHNVTINDFVYIAIPQNTTNQESYVVRIEPMPLKYVRDEDRNVFAVVRVAALPSEKVRVDVHFRVRVTGYSVRFSTAPPGTWPPRDIVAKYTGKTLYWNTYNVTLVNLAYKVGFADTPLSSATKLAVWLIPRIKYQVNLGRAGSDHALHRGAYGEYFVQGDCVEVADVYVTMARALGLPARTAYGFLLTSYSQRMWLNMSTVREEGEGILRHWGGHMWPQVYIPPLGWIDVDMLDGMQPNVGSLSARHVIFGFEETKYYGAALTSSCIPSYLALEYVEYVFEGSRV